MKRLTEKHYHGVDHYLLCSADCHLDMDCVDCPAFENAVERLAAYENTGMEPEQVEALKRQRWIPCSERMPELVKNNIGIEYSETVFALTNGRKIMAAFLRRVPGDKAIWIAPFNFWEAWDGKITHWAEFPPLPEPPEEGE